MTAAMEVPNSNSISETVVGMSDEEELQRYGQAVVDASSFGEIPFAELEKPS